MKHVFCVVAVLLLLLGGFAPTGFAYMPRPGEVKLCVPSPDGKRIATTQFGEPVRIWDIETGSANFGKEVQRMDVVVENNDTDRLYGNSSRVRFLTFLPDGKKIVGLRYEGDTATGAAFFDIWEIESGKKLQTLKGEVGDTRYLRVDAITIFSSDGKKIVAMLYDGTINDCTIINMWNVESGEVLQKLDGTDKFFYPGNLLLDVTKRVTASLRSEIKTATIGDMDFFRTAAFSPDGKKVVTGNSNDKFFRIWDVESGKELHVLTVFPTNLYLHTAFFSPDGRKVLTVSFEPTFCIWDADSGKMLHKVEIGIHFNMMRPQRFLASFSSDGKRIITTYGDDIRIWDAESGEQLQKIELQGLYRERQQ